MKAQRAPHGLLAAGLLAASCGLAFGAPPQNRVEHVASFDALALNGRFRLAFTRGPAQSVRLSGDSYLVENLQVAVRHGVLSIARPSDYDLPAKETVIVTITAPDLTRLVTHGLVRAQLSGLAGPDFSLTNNGAAAITLSGKVGYLSIISNGVASIDAGALHAGTAKVSVRGQGEMRVFAGNNADVTMYGKGRIEVLGHPKVHDFKTLAYGIITLK